MGTWTLLGDHSLYSWPRVARPKRDLTSPLIIYVTSQDSPERVRRTFFFLTVHESRRVRCTFTSSLWRSRKKKKNEKKNSVFNRPYTLLPSRLRCVKNTGNFVRNMFSKVSWHFFLLCLLRLLAYNDIERTYRRYGIWFEFRALPSFSYLPHVSMRYRTDFSSVFWFRHYSSVALRARCPYTFPASHTLSIWRK